MLSRGSMPTPEIILFRNKFELSSKIIKAAYISVKTSGTVEILEVNICRLSAGHRLRGNALTQVHRPRFLCLGLPTCWQ